MSYIQYSNKNASENKMVPLQGVFGGQLLVVLFLALGLCSCAGQVPPSGGPPDTQPPEIVHSSPAQHQTRVRPDAIELEFSEYVDRRSVEQSVFISPYVGSLKFDWSGTDVRITFSDSLRRNTTYVLTVGTDVVDVRAQNRMAASYVLAFSTGDSIDKGAISGRVYDEQPEGIMIFAYSLEGINPDTLSPSRERPGYVMQTGRGGTFSFSNVALGAYRLFAVKDEYKNLLYDRDVDQFGVLPKDIVLTPTNPSASGLAFWLAREDTIRPFVSSATALHRSFVEFRMSEPLDSNALRSGRVTVVDTVRGRSIPILLRYLSQRDPSIGGVILQEPLDSAAVYRLSIEGVHDRAGNAIDSAHASALFLGTSAVDTVPPAVTFPGLTDSSRGYPIDRPIDVVSSEPVRMSLVLDALVLSDSLGRRIPCERYVRSPVEGRVVTRQLLAGKAWYALTLPLDSLADYSGRSLRDSTLRVRFQTLDLKSTGSIEGVVVDRQASATGSVYVTVSSVNLSSPQVRTLSLPNPGDFKFENLPEAQYALSAFRDADSSGVFTAGRPFPFRPSERFVVGGDTVKVRARWGIEGVKLEFR